jgi:predicted ATPase
MNLGDLEMAGSVFLTRVVLKNYKSIGVCDVRLGPLTYLVGANGSGKSNFLNALSFAKDALSRSLDIAIRERGGLREIQQRNSASGRPRHFAIALDLMLRDGRIGYYAFEIGSIVGGAYAIQNESCRIYPGEPNGKESYFHIHHKGKVDSSVAQFPAVLPDRLALVALSGIAEFRELYESLCQMRFYNLEPRRMRGPQDPRDGSTLELDGGNISSVIGYLERNSPQAKALIEEYLSKVVPSINKVTKIAVGPYETLEFQQTTVDGNRPLKFTAQNMSDGTLRALGVLTALFQSGAKESPSLIGIEEPETALHPGASAALREALSIAAQHTQVIVTSHSPELLDSSEIGENELRFVELHSGESLIGTIDEASRNILKDRLFSAGELLRLNQLAPDPEVFEAMKGEQMRLFGDMTAR